MYVPPFVARVSVQKAAATTINDRKASAQDFS